MRTQVTVEMMSEFLKNHEIKPSLQRIKIFEYLANSKLHPNVDSIYKNLVDEIPTLSKTTVYNTLNLFIEKGIVNIVTIDESESRYDANISLHGHFKCTTCKMVYDFEIEEYHVVSDKLAKFNVQHRDIYYKGICEKCTGSKEGK